MACLDDTYYQTQITNAETIITTIMATIEKLAANPRASYSIDTGQTKETVTAASIPSLLNTVQQMEQLICFWYSQINEGENVTFTRPRW